MLERGDVVGYSGERRDYVVGSGELPHFDFFAGSLVMSHVVLPTRFSVSVQDR